MQVELQRSKKQYPSSRASLQPSQVQGLIPHDDVLGFDVPRRPRTCVARPRSISSVDLWFLQDVAHAQDDEEALVIEALRNLKECPVAAASAVLPTGRSASLPSGSAPPLRTKRNGSLLLPDANGRHGLSIGGSTWHAAGGPAKRRRSHDLLAGDDDDVDGEEGDPTQPYDETHSPPIEPFSRDDGPPYPKPGTARRGRGASLSAGGRGFALPCMPPNVDGRGAVSTRGGRAAARAGASGTGDGGGTPYMDEKGFPNDNKPRGVFLTSPNGGSRAGQGAGVAGSSRGWAQHGQAPASAARTASKAVTTGSLVGHTSEREGFGARSLDAKGPDEETEAGGVAEEGLAARAGSMGFKGEAELAAADGLEVHVPGRRGHRGGGEGQPKDRCGEGPAVGDGRGAGGPRSGLQVAGGSGGAPVKTEPGASSVPVSPSAEAAGCSAGGRGGAAASKGAPDAGRSAAQQAPPAAAAPSAGNAAAAAAAAAAASSSSSGKLGQGLSGMVPPLPPHLLAGGGPLGTWPPLPGLFGGPGPVQSWSQSAAAAAELLAKGQADTVGKATLGPPGMAAPGASAAAAPGVAGPFSAPGSSHFQQLQLQLQLQIQQQQQQQQQAALKANAALAAAAAGLPPVGSEPYIRALQVGSSAALAAHPLALQAAAAACGLGAPAGLPPGLPLAPAAGGGGGAAGPSSTSGGALRGGVPFKRCAQHVYIAHFIARQQQLQQQRQHQQSYSQQRQPHPYQHHQHHHQQLPSTSGGNGTTTTTTTSRNTHPNPSRAASGSPVLGRPTEGPAAQETSTGAGGGEEASGGGAPAVHSPSGVSNGGAGAGITSGGSSRRGQQQQQPQGVDTAEQPVTAGGGNVGGSSGGRPSAQPRGEVEPSAPSGSGALPSYGSGRGLLPTSAPPAPPHQASTAAINAAAAAASVAASSPGAQLLPPPGFPIPSHAAAAAAIMAQHHALATAAAAAAASGAPLGLPRGGPGPAPPLAPPPPVPGPLGVGPSMPPHQLAQLLLAGPPGAAAASGYGLPPFLAGLPNPFVGGAAVPSLQAAAAGGGLPAAALSAAAAAAAAAGVLPPGAAQQPGASALAASQLPPFFGGPLPPHFPVGPGGPMVPPSGSVVLPAHIAQMHQLAAAAWQQQAGL